MTDEAKSEPKPYTPPKGVSKHRNFRGEYPYSVTADWVVVSKGDKPIADVFYTHYKRLDAKGKRPITFVMNGGPGASSAYLHLGAMGPVRVAFEPNGGPLAAPVRLEDNADTWLAFTDLVFLDPVGTGLSRSIDESPKGDSKEPTKNEEFYSVGRDLEVLGEVISRLLSKLGAWGSPVVVAGESYGGYRTARLARSLQEKVGVGLVAVVAISPALEIDLLNTTDYAVLPFVDTFCPMALTAVFHGKSRAFAPGQPVAEIRQKIEAFAARTLASALVLPDASVAASIAGMLGLPEEMVARAGGRIGIETFARSLLKDEQRILGLYDGTLSAVDPFPDRAQLAGPDPTLYGVHRVFASGINEWLRAEVGLETDRIYELISFEVNRAWKRDAGQHALDLTMGATDDLRFAMSLNPHMRVLITHGYYDLVTPYFSTERLVAQMRLLPAQRERLSVRHFEGGHMFYSWQASRREFTEWARQTAYGPL